MKGFSGLVLTLLVTLCASCQKQATPDTETAHIRDLFESAKKDDKTALQKLTSLATAGHADALYDMGEIYSWGYGVPADSTIADQWYRQAAEEYRNAAERGDAAAQNKLGWMYQMGQTVPKDLVAAANWYRKAADQGNAEGEVNLGIMYDRGHGVPQDWSLAAQWYRKSAEQGDALGQRNLSVCYEQGEGVPKDLVSAYMWANLAAAQGVYGSKEQRDSLETQMTPSQIAEAQRLSGEWKPKR